MTVDGACSSQGESALTWERTSAILLRHERPMGVRGLGTAELVARIDEATILTSSARHSIKRSLTMHFRWLVAVGTIVLPQQVSAASFGCASATAPKDKLICQSPELSALDAQLAHLYQRKIAMLSPRGADLLRDSQQSWLRYIRTVCPMAPASTSDSRADPATCLRQCYQDRLTELDAVARKLGPFLFNQVDLFAAEPHDSSDDTGSVPGFYVQHLSYPQIDTPVSANTDAWNKIYDKGPVFTSVGCDGPRGDGETRYDVSYAGEHVISVTWSDSTYCHGTPHGFFSVGGENRVWDQGSRELIPADVFASPWQPKLQQLFWNALLAKGWQPPRDSAKDEVLAVVINPRQWSFTNDGLSVSFSAYEGGCYACNPGTTTVHWTELKPLLSSGSLVP
jgi:uncharacterized protein